MLLIEKAKNRTLPKETYTECHHIIPRSLGGSDDKDNLVRLTAREHYIAHLLLWKMKLPGEANMKMVHAFNQMCIMKPTKNHPGYRVSSRLFEKVKLERSAYLKTIRGEKHPSFGKPHNVTPEQRANITRLTKERWQDPEWKATVLENRKLANNRPDVVEKRKKKAESLRGIPRDPAIIEKGASKRRGRRGLDAYSEQALHNIREAAKNRIVTDEDRKRLSEQAKKTFTGRPKSEEWKKMMSEKMRGKPGLRGPDNPRYGKSLSDETKAKLSQLAKNRVRTPEQLARSKEIITAKCECGYCGKIVSFGNYNRWHGDNCKHNPASEQNRLAAYKTCEHCGKQAADGNFIRWHGDNCKTKQS